MNKINEQPCGSYFDSSDESIHLKRWVSNGFISTNRDALSLADPDHTYNLALRVLEGTGISPEDFKINNPMSERFKNTSKAELMKMVCELERELEAVARYCS